jgi:hypothetical protein
MYIIGEIMVIEGIPGKARVMEKSQSNFCNISLIIEVAMIKPCQSGYLSRKVYT